MSNPALESATTKIQLANSDVISFHDYNWPEGFEKRIEELLPLHRPLLCTEYMARGNGSTFDTILPLAKRYHLAAINWGLVTGQTQTNLPWDSWQRPYVTLQPTICFHDVFHKDDAPYRQREVDLMRELTGRGTPLAQPSSSAAAAAQQTVQHTLNPSAFWSHYETSSRTFLLSGCLVARGRLACSLRRQSGTVGH